MKTEAELRNTVLSEVRQVVAHGVVFTQDRGPESVLIPLAFLVNLGQFDQPRMTITLEEFDKIVEILLPPCPAEASLTGDDGMTYGDVPFWGVKCEYRVGHQLEHRAVVKQENVHVEFRWSDPVEPTVK